MEKSLEGKMTGTQELNRDELMEINGGSFGDVLRKVWKFIKRVVKGL